MYDILFKKKNNKKKKKKKKQKIFIKDKKEVAKVL
jgi:hypothetical protein